MPTKRKQEKKLACLSQGGCMRLFPFNAVTYPSFQPMIEVIGQYGVSMKGPTFHEVIITNLKKELALTKDLMKDHMVEWKKKMDAQLCRMDRPIGKREF